MSLKQINPIYRNPNSTNQNNGVPVLAGDLNTVINEVNSQDLRIQDIENTTGTGLFIDGTLMNDVFVESTDIAAITDKTELYKIYLVKDNISSLSGPNLISIINGFDANAQILESISFPLLESIGGSISIASNTLLTSINFNSLTTVSGASINFNSNSTVIELNLPSLVTANAISIGDSASIETIDLSALETSTAITVSNNVSLETINLANLETTTDLSISGNTSLIFLGLSSINTCDNITITNNDLSSLVLTSLTEVTGTLSIVEDGISSITIGSTLNCLSINFSGGALTVSAVNNILIQLDTAGFTDGVIDLSGGTSASPSGAGATAKTSLEGKNWVVTVN